VGYSKNIVNNYELRIQSFAGPLDKLLELIEARELPITSVSLSEVTADFLGYLKTLQAETPGGAHPKILTDFISVASKLILIKSHTLLPQLVLAPEEKAEMAELEGKLRIYRELKSAEKIIKQMWAKNVSFGRDALIGLPAGFYMSQALSANDLAQMVARLTEELAGIIAKTEEGQVVMINFEEKLKELMTRVDKTISSSFNEIVHGKERTEVIVLFLAILHLLKDSLVRVTQEKDFEDISIVKN